MKDTIKIFVFVVVASIFLALFLPEVESYRYDCWDDRSCGGGDIDCGSSGNSAYPRICCYGSAAACGQCGKSCSPPPPPPPPPPPVYSPPPPPPQPACTSVCWDDRACSGSAFNGYSNNPDYPVNCCTSLFHADRCPDPRSSSIVVCGDGQCRGYGENCNTCQSDCGSCQFCGDGSCNNNEQCWNGQTGCTDCGSCRALVYPNENSWCQQNCGADNSPNGRIECGTGFERFSKLYCNSLPPAGTGTKCGNCKAPPLYPNGKAEEGENCRDHPSDVRCLPNQICNANGVCEVNPCSLCTSTQTCVNNQCVTVQEICWNNIDDNGNGQVDENCGGCADLNGDNRVEWQDFFMLGDCETGMTSPRANCPANVFNRVDWNDNNILELEGAAAGDTPADLNGDRLVDAADFAILQTNFGKTGKNV